MFVFQGVMILDKVTLPETNSSPLKIGGWKTAFLLGQKAHFQVLLLLVSTGG